MKSIKTKLIAIYSAIILVVFAVGGTFLMITVRNLERDLAHIRLENHASLVEERVIQVYDPPFADVDWRMFGHGEYEVIILNEVGTPIAPAIFWGHNINNAAIIEAVGGNSSFLPTGIGLDRYGVEQQWLTFASPVSREGENFIIVARINAHFMNEALSRMTFYLLTMVVIVLVITIVLWFFLGGTITNPILELTRHAREIAAGGDLSKEIEISGEDEIGELINNFNYMSRELRSTLVTISREKNKSEAILQNTSHGVLAYDAMGRIVHVNNAGAELLHGFDIINMRMDEILEILGYAPESVEIRPGEVKESVYEEGEFALSSGVTSYSSEGGEVDGYLIVLQDITRQRKLDNMRKEFVANVSHELRTPLTSIRTYSETLLEGAFEDKETAKRFLKVIDDEAQRMSLLVSDLLELSRLDAKQTALEMDVVDLVALIRLSIRQAQIHAEHKRQTIELAPLTTPYFIEANAARINQVVYNILSNSIKYSPEDTVIRVSLETTEKYFRVLIKDSGIGIPTEDLGRVFERFYRVDKARARAMGGTGLGLAIVKEIMEEHGGHVHATSRQGHGTTVILRFNRISDVEE